MTKILTSEQIRLCHTDLHAAAFAPTVMTGETFPRRLNLRAYASFHQKGDP